MQRSALRTTAPKLLSLLAVACVVGCAAADPSDGEQTEGATSNVSEPVLLADFWSQVGLAQDGSRASMSTGAIEVPFLDPASHAQRTVGSPAYGALPLRGTCGVTFISPHYAITASHCVADENAYDLANQTFTVKTFDITTANLGSLYFDSNLAGTFPSFTTIGTRMDLEPGYHATPFACHIVSRCAFSEGGETSSDYNCGFAADVTMLNCPSRASNAPYLGVAASDPGTGDVEAYWFHEIVNAPTSSVGAVGTDSSLFSHYTTLSSQPSNWHYLAAPTNVLVPLKSIPSSGGVARKRLGPDSSDAQWTDVFGCHGTSGSGVLQRDANGNLELLGPVHHGNWQNTLCNNPSAAPGVPSISYENNALVRELTAKFSRALMFDRLVLRLPVGPIGLEPIATQRLQ
jgi:hypothetical protein